MCNIYVRGLISLTKSYFFQINFFIKLMYPERKKSFKQNNIHYIMINYT